MAERATFLVSDSNEGIRLDIFLSHKMNLTRSQIKRFIEKEKVLVNDVKCKPSYVIRAEDRIEVEIPPPPVSEIHPEPLPLPIIYQDRELLVVDKPAGMVVHPGAGKAGGTLVNALLYHFPTIKEVGSPERPGIVHRLDKETSGLILIAKTDHAFHELQKQFKERRVEKKYLTLVKGRMPEKEGKIEIPIGRHVRERKKISVRTTRPKEAITLYKVLEEFSDYSYLEVKPLTGRTHQIRVHLSSSGHPVVGDRKYGVVKIKVKCPRLFLHASFLAFLHPSSGQKLEFTLKLPSDLAYFLKKLRNLWAR